MRTFVTGGTGFIGSHFIKVALSRGHKIVALRRPGSFPSIDLAQEPDWVEGDLEAYPKTSFKECDTLLHLASFGVNPVDSSDWEQCFRWNVSASFKLWMSAIQSGVKRLVICGSCFEYGKSGEQLEYISTDTPLVPQTAYAASKAAATMLAIGLASSYDVEVIIIRPFHVYGEGEAEYRLWPSLKKAALQGDDFPMTLGEQIRDFVHVEALIGDILQVMEAPLTSGKLLVENLGKGQPITVRQFCQKWWDHWQASGELLIGALPYRDNEVMRFVPFTEAP